MRAEHSCIVYKLFFIQRMRSINLETFSLYISRFYQWLFVYKFFVLRADNK